MTDHQHKVFIGLGSNLGDSMMYLKNAIDELQSHQHIDDLKLSRYYLSKPHGPQDQPDYINGVAQFKTSLKAHDILAILQQIEKNNHRQRDGQQWGARTLDLDLLLYGNMIIHSESLVVPHPWMCERSFVLYPLQNLSPDLIFPDGRTLAQCIAQVPADELQIIH
jgi:2-amino-4-hydroxy-6-hydroxymethyldihydropteridine diphosphokinase